MHTERNSACVYISNNNNFIVFIVKK